MNLKAAKGLRKIAEKLYSLPEAAKMNRPQRTAEPLEFKGEVAPVPTGWWQRFLHHLFSIFNITPKQPTAYFYRRHRTGTRRIYHLLKGAHARREPWVLDLLRGEYREMKDLG